MLPQPLTSPICYRSHFLVTAGLTAVSFTRGEALWGQGALRVFDHFTVIAQHHMSMYYVLNERVGYFWGEQINMEMVQFYSVYWLTYLPQLLDRKLPDRRLIIIRMNLWVPYAKTSVEFRIRHSCLQFPMKLLLLIQNTTLHPLNSIATWIDLA